jgi:hypothetical protein
VSSIRQASTRIAEKNRRDFRGIGASSNASSTPRATGHRFTDFDDAFWLQGDNGPGAFPLGPLDVVKDGAEVIVEAGRVVFPQPADLLYDRIEHNLSLPSIVPGAKGWKFVARIFGGFRQAMHEFGVGNVTAIPREQVIHPVDGGDCDVESIFDGLHRNQAAREEAFCEFPGFAGEIKHGDTARRRAATSASPAPASSRTMEEMKTLNLCGC